MAVVAASLPRARAFRSRPVLATALVCLVAAALYAWMRVPAADEVRAGFTRWCGEFLLPSDWPCRLSAARALASFVGGSLLIGLAVALPGVVLAASGRRLSALVPVLLAAGASLANALLGSNGGSGIMFGITETVFGSGETASFWGVHAGLATAVDTFLLCVPALAVAFVLRPVRRPRPEPLPRHAAWMATFTVGGAIGVLTLMWSRATSEYFASPAADPWIAVGLIALFGAMLGTDRRVWPWALAPVAVLLSLGPAMAVMAIPSRLTVFTWFGSVLPLAATGLIASLWRPLAMRFAGRGRQGDAAKRVTPSVHVRPVVAANAIAAAALLLSVVATTTDPLGIQIATSLPTYLGARELAQDVRTKTNLSEAIGAMQRYRAEHGTYRGFDPRTGELMAPELAWSDAPTSQELVVRITEASPTTAQVVARSGSHAVFCVQASGGAVTFGAAERGDVLLARAACGTSPFTSDTLRMLDVETLCVGVDDSAIVLCRSVQRLLRETLATPTPA